MVLLPIVDRELRAASRRKSTHRIRLWTTAFALLVSLFFLVTSVRGVRAMRLGANLFSGLAHYSFVLSLLTGVFFASDCISEEKREGTLGFLFLTDLKGYDVIFGKLAAIGLSAAYGLISILPVISLSLLMGGVTGGEFWRMSLALMNALFFSMAAGVLISTLSRENARAMGATLALLLAVNTAVPAMSYVLRLARAPGWIGSFLLFSPYSPFNQSFEVIYKSPASAFWSSLMCSQFVAWSFLALACVILPRVWQDKQFRARSSPGAKEQGSDSSVTRPLIPVSSRQKLEDENPISWLAGADRAAQSRAWWIAGIAAVVASAVLLADDTLVLSPFAGIVLMIAGFLLKILFAFQACAFFVEARKSGALELILSTPLKSREIISGQWLALKRIFLGPAILFLSAQLVIVILQIVLSTRTFGPGRFNGTGLSFNFIGLALGGFGILAPIYAIVKWLMDIYAIGWVGMWLGLSSKKPNLAAAATILFVVILPSLAICVPNPVIDICFILWAREKLIREFRLAAMPHYHTNQFHAALRPPLIVPRRA